MTVPRGYCWGCRVYSTEAACFYCGGDMQLKTPPDFTGHHWSARPMLRDGMAWPEFDGHYPF